MKVSFISLGFFDIQGSKNFFSFCIHPSDVDDLDLFLEKEKIALKFMYRFTVFLFLRIKLKKLRKGTEIFFTLVSLMQ